MRAIFLTFLLTFAVLALVPPVIAGQARRVVFLAGRPSHGYGSHEHLAGCRLLADAIARSTQGRVVCEVFEGGWPEDDSVLDGADSIVMYCDGGGGHPALNHLDRLGRLIGQGTGFVCIHYAVEVPIERGGPEFLEWLGGYFETHWSVNPHWVADYTELPEHAVTRGVRPFRANDEWYFHMRFRPGMEGVTPILSAVPPQLTMLRPDGPHSGNPTVRKAVADGQPQHTAWVFERPDGGRSFGFTGGHFHWNWGREEILRLVCNAIVWTAKHDVPEAGLPVLRPSVERLEQGQDYPVPKNHEREKVQRDFQLISRPADTDQSRRPIEPGRQLAKTEVITGRTQGKAQQLVADVTGVKTLLLIVDDAEDGFNCDWADWIQPKLVGDGRPDLDLTTLDWAAAETQWGQVHRGKNANGGPLSIAGERFATGIGTHANSVIVFELPPGYQRLHVTCGLDDGGARQPGGEQASVQFFVYADAWPGRLPASGGPERDPAAAVADMQVAEGVAASLAAAEPMVRSLTNLDIDHRGRVWVCEVVNYRSHVGKRPEGDRILILEDEDGDGVMDTCKVYYQGSDIDSAMGICVLGNRVIVSASPHIWVFTDENGDDLPDRKELLFSQTGQPQHDHSAHSFLFGPDGKLYWNFGNTGKAVHDSAGTLVVDQAGNAVIDNGQPYYGGMVFRCDLTGEGLETLAHNFRNNYELCVDAFGGMWQSDNDDDGNKATRINYVMDFGNFGYRDELTGAGWQSRRINLEATIPERHWHLNDPGVVPTMLITGAGSPSGITLYDGDLLPQRFHGRIIHCEPGRNVVRAYPVQRDGAGYTATMDPLIEGRQDRWFRPVDVCTAPDGSLFITDWYDPGVGGHQMGDLTRGRLYRLAPPGVGYTIPSLDLSSPRQAVAALLSPNQATRYLAWQAVERLGQAAREPLEQLSADPDPRTRARAYWALGKLAGQGRQAIAAALSDSDPDVRCMAVRLARQLQVEPSEYFVKVLGDASPAVRRELAIALRFDSSGKMPSLWAALAATYDGRDRWYLEALGIGAALRWSECYEAYAARMADQGLQPHRDIVWRARTERSVPQLIEVLAAENLKQDEARSWLRALEYHSVDSREAVIARVLSARLDRGDSSPIAGELLVELMLRSSQGAELSLQPRLQTVVTRRLAVADRQQRLDILGHLSVPDADEWLLDLAAYQPTDSISIGAAQILLRKNSDSSWLNELAAADDPRALPVVEAVAAAAPRLAASRLIGLVHDQTLPASLRGAAAKGLTRSSQGQRELLAMAESGQLPSESRLMVGSLLRGSEDESVKRQAAELFPPMASKTTEPLPPLTELIKRSGDANRGGEIYRTTGTCAKCHPLAAGGSPVGPDLSEIGGKLAKEALYVAILDPSAGISHNFESYAVLAEDGQLSTGLLVSQTEDEIILRDAEGLDRRFRRGELESVSQLPSSLMPDNLAELLTVDELVDLVEFLQGLRKR